jgi:hypothetical protein
MISYTYYGYALGIAIKLLSGTWIRKEERKGGRERNCQIQENRVALDIISPLFLFIDAAHHELDKKDTWLHTKLYFHRC